MNIRVVTESHRFHSKKIYVRPYVDSGQLRQSDDRFSGSRRNFGLSGTLYFATLIVSPFYSRYLIEILLKAGMGFLGVQLYQVWEEIYIFMGV
jgi:hypothetical protein